MFSPVEQIVLPLWVSPQTNSTLGPVACMWKGRESRAELWGTVPIGLPHASDSLVCQQKHLLYPPIFLQGNAISETRSRQKYCADIVIRLKGKAEMISRYALVTGSKGRNNIRKKMGRESLGT